MELLLGFLLLFLVSRLQGSGCRSLCFLQTDLSSPSHLKLESTTNQALSSDFLKPSSQQSCIKGGLLILLYSLLIVSFWYFLLTFCPWGFITYCLHFQTVPCSDSNFSLASYPPGNMSANYCIPVLCTVVRAFLFICVVFLSNWGCSNA